MQVVSVRLSPLFETAASRRPRRAKLFGRLPTIGEQSAECGRDRCDRDIGGALGYIVSAVCLAGSARSYSAPAMSSKPAVLFPSFR